MKRLPQLRFTLHFDRQFLRETIYYPELREARLQEIESQLIEETRQQLIKGN